MGKGYRIAYDQPINQYEKSGKYVKTYSSIRDITSNYNNRRQIRYVCQRRQGHYTAMGFQWRYYKEHPNHENIQPYFKDTWSYGQKMVYRLLINSGIDFIVHWKPKWGNKKQYDFYIPAYQLIIEVNGRQHYMNVGNHWPKLVDQQDNDNKKREVALKNGIKSYFYIDTRFQRMQYIKESICKSGILEFLGILEVDWNDLIAFSLRGMDLAVKDIWDSGQHNAKKIAEKLQIKKSAVIHILKRIDRYITPSYSQTHFAERKPVLQFSKDGTFIKEYNSISEASRAMGHSCSSSITKCCANKQKTAYGYVWKFKNERHIYKDRHKNSKRINVYDLKQNFIRQYNSMVDLCNDLGFDGSAVSKVCNRSHYRSGKYIFRYSDDCDDITPGELIKCRLPKKLKEESV